ncbi:MAG TPA: hypothetical protein VHG93_10925 [Longimicrobium sp.]|nr:hypothetical protein [Longimicrobium sp.]
MRHCRNPLALVLLFAGLLAAWPAPARADHDDIDPTACYWAEFVIDGHCVGPTTQMCMGPPECMAGGVLD